ncbi:MAG TPA: glycosyltransferase family 4 protein [Polyangia bacterium]|nr:glycosyltransferase family 4 protein [Polyangia bacterium]
MNALLVSTHFPRDASYAGGVHRRLDMLMAALTSASDKVTALFLVRPDAVDAAEPARRAYEDYLRGRWSAPIALRLAPVRRIDQAGEGSGWRRLLEGTFDFRRTAQLRPLYNDDAVTAVRAALAEQPAIVFAHRLDAMSVLLRVPAGEAKVFFDLDDVEHVATFRRLVTSPQWPGERLQLLHVPALMAGERQALRRARATFVCSQKDKALLGKLFGARAATVRVVPNATAIPEAPLPVSADKTVLFVGTFDYRPNVDAADRLARSIWPLVRARVPDARLVIVGKRPEVVPAFSASPRDESVTFTGFVDDIRTVYPPARVVCCPIGTGAGTRVKIVEAAGFARPVVSTALGAEGLDFADGSEILLRETDEALAAACSELLLDERRAATLGQAAWQRARAVYDRATTVRALRDIFLS